jgi:Fe-S-cluster containining protein
MHFHPNLEEVVKEQPDCTKCGLCCIPDYQCDFFVNLSEKDVARLPKRAQKLVHRWSPEGTPSLETVNRNIRRGPLKGAEICACVFLRGAPLVQVSCAIYAARPRVCRDAIKPGSRLCQRVRKDMKLWIESAKILEPED